AAGVVGTGSAGSCTNQALGDALAGGGAVTFNCGPLAHTIVITQNGGPYINPTTNVGGGGGRHLPRHHARPAVRPAPRPHPHPTPADGLQPGNPAGAIYNQGTLRLDDVTVRDNAAGGPTRVAGAIYNDSTGRVVIRQSQFLRNQSNQGGAIFNVHGGVLDIAGT